MQKSNNTNLWVKVCGLTRSEDLSFIAENEIDAIGLVFVKSSKRFVNDHNAKEISQRAKTMGLKVAGVFSNHLQHEIEKIASMVNLDMIQLHGNEPPELCKALRESLSIPIVKAIAVVDSQSLDGYARYNICDAILLDNKDPGSGKRFDWNLIAKNIPKSPPTILAGGITSFNIHKINFMDQLWGIDLSSSVESAPGIKSEKLIKELRKSIDSLPQN